MTRKESTKKTTATRKGQAAKEELDAFAHHLAECLRISRTNPFITTRFYNDLGDAWNDFTNDMPDLSGFCQSEEYIRLALHTDQRQRAQNKGGER
jgi:hypothetical protein